MLDIIGGGEPFGPYVPGLPASSFASCVGEDLGKLRIGVRVPSAITPKPHPEAYAAVESAVRVLTELGHHVEELPTAPFDDAKLVVRLSFG
jgi:amidase